MTALMEPFHCFAQSNSSSILTLLCLFLHQIFCVLFDITSEHSAELKWLMLHKHKRWFHSSHLVSMSASSFLVSMYLIWIFNEAQLWGSGNFSHCRASSLCDHLDYCFIVFKHIQQKLPGEKIGRFGGINSTSSDSLITPEIAFVFESCEVLIELKDCSFTRLTVLYYSDSCFQGLRRTDPIIESRNIVQPQSCTEGNDSWFCWTVRNWS